MKVIVTGATGLIGGATLRRLLTLPSITSVIALSRRDIGITDPKLETVILKDFHHYPADVLARLSGAEACIWALGRPTDGGDVHDALTFAGADAFAASLLPRLKEGGKKFRFMYVSGHFVEPDQDANLWWLGATRKLRGVVEHKIIDYEKTYSPSWETFVARPAAVTVGKPIYSPLLLGLWIPVEELAAALADVVVNGKTGDPRLANGDLRARGQEALAKTS
ncbi:hypothetical protein BDZ85DRAFT_29507 [Elsinoe ampelina]|uniref:NAD(P)-binding domain-containing protein n=1 Tax=Elsinoe ampelina TaxID=302913 RepID=A0A6A6G4Y0_9PEZI|nr:hypothetical protein BDZ85DRAFT_29507 [Elsinoe ampelina]